MPPDSSSCSTVVIASHNPVKIQAVSLGFHAMFPEKGWAFQGISALSGVRDQPLSDHETLLGAMNRSQNAACQYPCADYWVGIEGGIQEMENEMFSFAWVVVRSRERIGKGRTATFFLPERVAELIRAGKELGEADDIVFQRSNSKQENGAIGILTENVIDRVHLYLQAVIIALIPHKNPHLYLPFISS